MLTWKMSSIYQPKVKHMTRINVGFSPDRLSAKMLLAEHREIKRIPNAVKSGRASLDDLPVYFALGKGHVKFFYNKLGYLLSRYNAVRAECLKRGYNVADYSSAWAGIPKCLMGDYEPSDRDKALIEARIAQRLGEIHDKTKTP